MRMLWLVIGVAALLATNPVLADGTDHGEQIGRSLNRFGHDVEHGAKTVGHKVESGAKTFGHSVVEGWRSFKRGLTGD